jgi:hypothetical protein
MTNYPEMDLLDAERMSPTEVDALHARLLRRGVTGYPLTVFALWTQHNPSLLKRYMLQVDAQMPSPQAACLCNIATLYHYTVLRFSAGVAWELDTAARAGFTKAEVLEIFALAYLTDGPATQHAVHEGAAERLRSWATPQGARPSLPPGWDPDPAAFRSGLEVSVPPVMSDEEHQLLRDWYQRTIGEVPPSVEFLAAHQPALLKAYRLRWEHCIRVLPKQVMPFVMLHRSAMRGDVSALREAALLGRAWGMTREEAVLGVTAGLTFGAGLDPMGAVNEALAEILDAWPERGSPTNPPRSGRTG